MERGDHEGDPRQTGHRPLALWKVEGGGGFSRLAPDYTSADRTLGEESTAPIHQRDLHSISPEGNKPLNWGEGSAITQHYTYPEE